MKTDDDLVLVRYRPGTPLFERFPGTRYPTAGSWTRRTAELFLRNAATAAQMHIVDYTPEEATH